MDPATSTPLVNGTAGTAVGSSRSARPNNSSASASGRGSKKARMKHRGSQTCSSDEDDLHSDDNLRPYEEVKVAHHDKKLAGLGLTPDESAVSPIMTSDPKGSSARQGGGGGQVYDYGSDEEAEARVPLQGNPIPGYQMQPPPPHQHHHLHHPHPHPHPHIHPHAHPHHPPVVQGNYQFQQQQQPQQQQQSKQPRPGQTPPQYNGHQERVVYDPPWDHINFEQMRNNHQRPPTTESDEDNRQAAHRYSQSGTLPMPPPTLPPPPPPPLEDMPQRSPAPQRQRSFGPSMRGNYSDMDFRHEQQENPYMVQNALGAAYTMDGCYGHQRHPMHRSGSVPSGHSHGMDGSDHYISSGHSDTYPYHCPNNVGDGPVIVHNNDRQVLNYPHSAFGVAAGPPGNTAYAPPSSHDYQYYSKFSTAGNRMKKKIGQRCTWKCTAILLLLLCVALLAITVYFGVKSMNQEEKVEKECLPSHPSANGTPNYRNQSTPPYYNGRHNNKGGMPLQPTVAGGPRSGSNERGKTTEAPAILQVGQAASRSVAPGTFWMSQMEQKRPGAIKLNLSVPRDAMVGVYGRRGLPPSNVQFDFFKVIDGSRVGYRPKRSLNGNAYVGRDTALVQFLDKGTWYLGIYNDRETFQTILMTAEAHDLETGCDQDCHGNGECRNGKCNCFLGYTGTDCSQSLCPLLCSGNGVYLRGQCQCNSGWKGPECGLRETECAVPDCNGYGQCIDGRCSCFSGYKGSDCGIVDCVVPNCSGNGVCILGTCRCFRGFKGGDCSIQDKLNVTQLCSRGCSENGLYDVVSGQCECRPQFSGAHCETEICLLKCEHGQCENQKCVCDSGWTGVLCELVECDHRCEINGYCENGTCTCNKGWNGKHCTIDGCSGDCNNHGSCRHYKEGWRCDCRSGWKGPACNVAMETSCSDKQDNDLDGLKDCLDPDCCSVAYCRKSSYCSASPNPKEILLGKNAPSPTASFLDKMRFLIEENSVQIGAPRNSFNESQASVIRGRVETSDGTPLIGVRVTVVTQPLYGYTLTRKEGLFDILVNGGGSVTLEFVRDPFNAKTASVLVPWNQFITMDTVVMTIHSRVEPPRGKSCSNLANVHEHYLLRPVVLSTWQHTQLGACPERSTIIPESQVLQESLDIPSTDVHLVYHSSESSGYMSLIMIQMTPEQIPNTLALVHLRVSVQGVVLEKLFEADPNLKYTFAWDRLNAFKQKVYGIVSARVYVGYQYLGCDHIYWETHSATLNGYDMTASYIGGWNLDIHHTYNHQEGILHKGDGTNIYLKEKPKKIINILGSGQRRNLNCEACNGKALDNGLLSPVALASGLDGSVYVGDFNFIRKLSPFREEIASILHMSTLTTPYKFYMTVSPVDGRLYISDLMSLRIIRIRTMGPVTDLLDNYEVVAGNGEECTPGDSDLCGDGELAVHARLRHPKGIAISKDGTIFLADGSTIRKITRNGIITTLIGSQAMASDWTPMPCDNILAAEKVNLKWPTALSINPLDNSLHILDHSIVLKLTADFKLVTVAGRPVYCPPRHSSFLPSGVLNDDEQATNVADHVNLVSPKSITFGPHGDLYIVESNNHNINRIRVVSTDGHIHHFAGAKSKCDCSQTDKCACYNPRETLAAQALFSDPTSVTVTPDGVLHVADIGNLRVFSIVSELPVLSESVYKVVAPETQEMYVFNMYGHHRHTINIHTGHYIYNFSYNVFSSHAILISVEDATNNKIQIKRDYDLSVKYFVTPSGEKCNLSMDNRHRLHKYQTQDNSTSTFTYTIQTGLLESKQDSNGQTFRYDYDANGRLLTVRQPTGQITSLTTDINTTGSIVRVATGMRHVSAMATYGSVHSVLHGNTQTKVTYLPDGAVVVLFPSNLTVAIETGRHPIMESDYRMHYKRKVIIPGSAVHRLEWRFYVRRGSGRGRSSRVIEKHGQRMRVGDPRRQHVVHDPLGEMGTEKALLINGVNLLTVEYDRLSHTETVLDKNLQSIITVVYNSAGLPIQFQPASSHHSMNITYNSRGDITEWKYGELMEIREYNKVSGVIAQRTLKPGGKHFRYFYRTHTSKPTDVFLPSGKQYLFKHDMHGNLRNVMSPLLGYHRFSTLLTMGMKRYMYKAPSFSLPYIEDYDAMGNLLQIMYPSEQRRILYRYNDLSQRSLTMFDQTLIEMDYHREAQHLSIASLVARGYANTLTFEYLGSLVRDSAVTFPQDSSLIGATLSLSYDNHFRQTATKFILTNDISLNSNCSYSSANGKLSYVGNMKIEWVNWAKQVFSNSKMSMTREFDGYGKLIEVKVRFGGSVKFAMAIDYDKIGRVHEWTLKVGKVKDVKVEYIYDVDSHVTDVLLQGKATWEFGYDGDGNIDEMTSYGRKRHMEFDQGDKITMMGGVSYKFDKDGLMAQRGLEQVAFNSAGQLISITRHSLFKYSYFYDALGRLAVQRDRYGRILQFFYTDMKRNHLITHIYNHTTGVLTEYFRDSKETIVALQRGKEMYYVVVDPSSTPLVVFDNSGTVKKRMMYDPLGMRKSDSNPDFEFAFGFQGRFYNPVTNLVHFWDRVYDANLGRYLTPDYGNVFGKLARVAEDPEILNLYSHRFLINTHLQNQHYPRMDLSDWLNVLSYDLKSMSPDVTYTGELNPGPAKPDMQLLPASSAFECTFRRDMHNLLTISSVPKSKVTPLQTVQSETPAPLSSIFGQGVTISNINGNAVVNILDIANSWAKNLAASLLNSSQVLPIHFTINGKDVHYFVKPSAKDADNDLRSLGIHSDLVTYESGLNVSIHRNQHGHGISRREVDVRIHGNHTVLNVRYGTTMDREMRRVLHHAKDRAVNHAWSREQHLLHHSLPSVYHWSDSEIRQIVANGRVTGYVADYIHHPDKYPELSDDCNNIRFVPEVP